MKKGFNSDVLGRRLLKKRTWVVSVSSQTTCAKQHGLKSEKGHIIQASQRALSLREPIYRYIHRVLSNSVCQRRDSTGVVNLRDFTVLYCIHNHIPLDVTHLLLRNMHLNPLASSPTPIFSEGWIYRLFKTCVQRMPKSFHKAPRSGKVDLTQCYSMGIIHEMGDETVKFRNTQGHVWNPEEALVLHDDPTRPPPQY
ncbi:hypothetical protein Hanom_Chr06g00529651 [Helianthus anomalus]